jgi:Lon protease-like protein
MEASPEDSSDGDLEASLQAAIKSFGLSPSAIAAGPQPEPEDDAAEGVRWLPELDPSEPEAEPSAGATVMPLFPLGVTYLPFGTEVLNIFEPRYRAMYNDIILTGARRFLVCSVDKETGRFAEVGSIFYLDNLKEVSEQTKDRVKYVGTHNVIGRAKIKKVLNPAMASTRESYLRAEVEELVDKPQETGAAETELGEAFDELIKTQDSAKVEPRFTEDVKNGLDFSVGTSAEAKGLWGPIALWQQLLLVRVQVTGRKMQAEIKAAVGKYFQEHPDEVEKYNGEVNLNDLPPELYSGIKVIQKRYGEELEASDSDPYGLPFQELLQAESHKARLGIFRRIIEEEIKRLQARDSLQTLMDNDN